MGSSSARIAEQIKLQYSGVVEKNRASHMAVSTVMAVWSLTRRLIRVQRT